jgi:hypothetical protein
MVYSLISYFLFDHSSKGQESFSTSLNLICHYFKWLATKICRGEIYTLHHIQRCVLTGCHIYRGKFWFNAILNQGAIWLLPLQYLNSFLRDLTSRHIFSSKCWLPAFLNSCAIWLAATYLVASLTGCSNIYRTVTTCHYTNSGRSTFEFENLGEFETEFGNILE